MTTAPKLIREQLLMLTALVNDLAGEHDPHFRIDKANEINAVLSSLAAEPVGGAKRSVQTITMHRGDDIQVYRKAGYDEHHIIWNAASEQPDSAEGDAVWICKCHQPNTAFSSVCCKCNSWRPASVEMELRAGKGEDSREAGSAYASASAEQPKAEGVEIEWPYIFTNTGGMEYVPRHHAERRIAALSAAPQPEHDILDGKLWLVEDVNDPDSPKTELEFGIGFGDGANGETLFHRKTQPEQPARDGVTDDEEWLLTLSADWDFSIPSGAFDQIVNRFQPPQQADAEIQPVQCPQCLHAFAIPSITQQADGGAVACWIAESDLDVLREHGQVCVSSAKELPNDISLFTRPPKSPGVGVDDAMVGRAHTAYWSTEEDRGDDRPAMRAALLAALGGEK